MTSVNTSELSTLLSIRAPLAFDNAVTEFAFFWNLLPKRAPSDGQGPTWMVRVDSHDGAAELADGGLFPAADKTTQVRAALPWKYYGATVEITRQFMEQYAESPQRLENHANEQLMAAVQDIISKFEADFRTDLVTAIDDTATYAGINRGTYANWAAPVTDNSGTPAAITVARLQAITNTLIYTNGGMWDIGFAPKSVVDTLAAITSPTRTNFITGDGSGPFQTAIRLGYSHVFYDDKPIVAYPQPVASTLFGLSLASGENTYIEVIRSMLVDEPKRVGDSFEWNISMGCKLVHRNPRKTSFKMEDVT